MIHKTKLSDKPQPHYLLTTYYWTTNVTWSNNTISSIYKSNKTIHKQTDETINTICNSSIIKWRWRCAHTAITSEVGLMTIKPGILSLYYLIFTFHSFFLIFLLHCTHWKKKVQLSIWKPRWICYIHTFPWYLSRIHPSLRKLQHNPLIQILSWSLFADLDHWAFQRTMKKVHRQVWVWDDIRRKLKTHFFSFSNRQHSLLNRTNCHTILFICSVNRYFFCGCWISFDSFPPSAVDAVLGSPSPCGNKWPSISISSVGCRVGVFESVPWSCFTFSWRRS